MPEKFEIPEKFENKDRVLQRIEWEKGEAIVRYVKEEEEDVDAIIDAVLSMRKVDAKKGKKDFIPLDDKNIEGIKREITDSQEGKMIVLVIEAEGSPRGFVEIRPESGDTAVVGGITVHENYRRKHFGTALLNNGILEAQRIFGAKKIELQTDEDNEARGLYEECGFVEVPIDPKKYPLTKDRNDKTVNRIGYEKILEDN